MASDAQDRAVVVDESLLEVFESFRGAQPFEHVIVVSHSGNVPLGAIDYEELIARQEAMNWPALEERRAAACATRPGPPGGRRAWSLREHLAEASV